MKKPFIIFSLITLISFSGGKIFAQNLPLIPGIYDRKEKFFKELFRIAKEPKLSKKNGDFTQIRLTLLRSMDPTIIIRIEASNHAGQLILKQFKGKYPPKDFDGKLKIFEEFTQNGSPIYKNASLATENNIPLQASDCQLLLDSLQSLNFFEKPTDRVKVGARDGSVWMLEVWEKGAYHYYPFRPENDLPAQNFCKFLIQLSQAIIEPLY